jgi:hypothetical protein
VSNYPVHQGGDRARASQVWGVTTRVAPYGLLVPPTPVPTPPVEVEAESPIGDLANEEWTEHIITDVDGSLGWRGRWLVRLVLRIVVHKRRP